MSLPHAFLAMEEGFWTGIESREEGDLVTHYPHPGTDMGSVLSPAQRHTLHFILSSSL